MTIYATTWAWEQETANPGQRLVLLAMADNAAGPDSDEPGLCWPSVDLIAAKCHLSTRQVKRHLADLHEAGLVIKMQRRRRRDGSLSVWEYVVPYQGTPTSPRDSPRGHTGSALGDTHGKPKGTSMSPQEEPSLEPSEEPSSLLADFELFWQMYGRVGSKKVALEHWLKAVKSGATPDEILNGLEPWVVYWKQPGAANIKWPQGWLNERRWEGAPPPVLGSSKPLRESAGDIIDRIARRDSL